MTFSITRDRFFLAFVIIRRVCPINFRCGHFTMDCGAESAKLDTVTHIYMNLYTASSRYTPDWPAPSRRVNIHALFFIQSRRGSSNFSKGGGVEEENLKEKCLLIHVTMRVHIKTRQTCNSFSLLPLQEDCFVLLLSFIFEIRRGGVQPP